MSSTFRRFACTAVCLAVAGSLAGASCAAPSAAPGAPDPLLRLDVQTLVDDTNELVRRTLAEQMPMLLAMDDAAMLIAPSPGFMSREFGDPREIVKNAPYTAEAVTESIQTLPDGNRIVKKSTALLARDTMGRTRQERKGDHGATYIYDPLENRSVAIDSATRSVSRLPRVPIPPTPPVAPVPPQPPVAPAPPQPPAPGMAPPPPGADPARIEVGPERVVIRRGPGARAGSGQPMEDVRVEVVRDGHDLVMHAMPPLPPITLPLLPRGKGETKSLGTREFDGIKADGTMTTHTIPAGAVGNEKPILITSERWFSPDLFVVVYAKSSDPRAGETTYRLTNVKRGEPPADLFKIPADAKSRGEARK